MKILHSIPSRVFFRFIHSGFLFPPLSNHYLKNHHNSGDEDDEMEQVRERKKVKNDVLHFSSEENMSKEKSIEFSSPLFKVGRQNENLRHVLQTNSNDRRVGLWCIKMAKKRGNIKDAFRSRSRVMTSQVRMANVVWKVVYRKALHFPSLSTIWTTTLSCNYFLYISFLRWWFAMMIFLFKYVYENRLIKLCKIIELMRLSSPFKKKTFCQ